MGTGVHKNKRYSAMSGDYSTTARLEGPQGTHVTLEDFAAICDALRISLNHVARCISLKRVTYEVRDLKASSAQICIAPAINGVPDECLADLTTTFNRAVFALENDQPLDERLDYAAIRALDQLARPVKLRRASLRIGDVSITQRYVSHIARLIEPSAGCFGSVSGMLEAVSVHGKTTFTLYPPIESEHVECSFAKSELKMVIGALGQNVTVYGMLKYAKRRAFPVSAEVDHFDVEPPDKSLPTLLDARHQIAGGLSSLDVVREIRNGW
jgi:hypothetical protein